MTSMGMIFTNSGKQTRRNIQAPIQAPIQVQPRSFPPSMNTAGGPASSRGAASAGGAGRGGANRGFRTMDLGNLKTSKSCGSCGH